MSLVVLWILPSRLSHLFWVITAYWFKLSLLTSVTATVDVRTPQNCRLGCLTPTALVYLVTCILLLNCTTGVFQVILLLLEIRDIDFKAAFELWIYDVHVVLSCVLYVIVCNAVQHCTVNSTEESQNHCCAIQWCHTAAGTVLANSYYYASLWR